MDKIDIEKLQADIAELDESETRLYRARGALQEPLELLIREAGLGAFCFNEKITACYETTEGGLSIYTEDSRGESYSYSIPGEIMKAEDPLAAAKEFKRRKASEADDKRRARTLAEIERLKGTL